MSDSSANSAPAAPPSCSIHLRYGNSESQPSSTDAPCSTAPLMHDFSASTAALPVCPAASSPLRVSLRCRLRPQYRRADVGSLCSTLRALQQTEARHIMGWEAKVQEEGTNKQEEKAETQNSNADSAPSAAAATADSSTSSSSSSAVLHLQFWTNTSFPSSNLPLISAQRQSVARLPAAVARLFGSRELEDIVKATVHSVYSERGITMPTAAAATKGNYGERESNVAESEIDLKWPAGFASLLEVLRSRWQLHQSKQPSPPADSVASAASEPATSFTSAAPDASAASSHSLLVDPTPAPPLHFDSKLALLPQFSRGFLAVLSMMKKSVDSIDSVEINWTNESRGNRSIRADLQGCDFAALAEFLRHQPPTVESPATSQPNCKTQDLLRDLDPLIRWIRDEQ